MLIAFSKPVPQIPSGSGTVQTRFGDTIFLCLRRRRSCHWGHGDVGDSVSLATSRAIIGRDSGVRVGRVGGRGGNNSIS